MNFMGVEKAMFCRHIDPIPPHPLPDSIGICNPTYTPPAEPTEVLVHVATVDPWVSTCIKFQVECDWDIAMVVRGRPLTQLGDGS